jgi:hypothetical protein
MMPPRKRSPARAAKRTGTKPESQTTAEFLIALSKSPKLKAAWKRNPVATMRTYGLSEKAIKALKSGNPKTVAKHLGDDAPPGCFIFLIVA